MGREVGICKKTSAKEVLLIWLSRLDGADYYPDLDDVMRTSLKYIIDDTNHNICTIIKRLMMHMISKNNIDLDIACYQLVQYCEKCSEFNLCIDRHDSTSSASSNVPKYWMDLVAAVEYIYG